MTVAEALMAFNRPAIMAGDGFRGEVACAQEAAMGVFDRPPGKDLKQKGAGKDFSNGTVQHHLIQHRQSTDVEQKMQPGMFPMTNRENPNVGNAFCICSVFRLF